MELGYIGLGKMGFNMVLRLLEKGHRIVVYNRSKGPVEKAAEQGAVTAGSIATIASQLASPRLVWIMVPYDAVDAVLDELIPNLRSGDTVIDGGNSPYKESVRRAATLGEKGIAFLDAGVSGGPGGARTGACVMVGGRRETYLKYEALFRDISADNGCAYAGESGAGHFVKMVHNGIEYGMMQSLAEGFAVLRASPYHLKLTELAELYNHRSVIESRLVEWLKEAYEQFGEDLEGVSGAVTQSGEGLWTVEAARELGVPAPVISEAVDFRGQSQKAPSYTGKVLSAMRNRFGGHEAGESRGQGRKNSSQG